MVIIISPLTKRLLLGSALLLIITDVIIPVFVHFSPWLFNQIIFMNLVRVPLFKNLSEPGKDFGLENTTNFYVNVKNDIKLGVWYIPPAGHNVALDELCTMDHQPMILYLHGNMGTRGIEHRVTIYKSFQQLGYHTVTFDYRGFGDSTGWPSEEGLVEDAIYMIEWVRGRTNGLCPIILWGHSLGTAVGTHALAKYETRASQKTSQTSTRPAVSALVLEAPFTNLRYATHRHFFTAVWRHLPYFEWAFLDPLPQQFTTDRWLPGALANTRAVAILHAEDDEILPYDLGRDLAVVGFRAKGGAEKLVFVTFAEHEQCRHNNIVDSPRFEGVVRDVVARATRGVALESQA